MLAALGQRFEIVDESATAYLYRYACGRLEACERGVRVSRQLFEQESHRIDEGSLPAIALRIIGRRTR